MTKSKKAFVFPVLLAAATIVSGCASLNEGLAQVNSTLGSINSSLSGSSPSEGKTISDKQTSVYALKNMKISAWPALNGKGLRLTGEAYNKTDKLVRLYISIPIYDKDGFKASSLFGEIHLSGKEKERFEFNTPGAVPDGARYDLQKIKVHHEVF